MKKLYVFSNFQLLLLLFAFAPKVHSQCLVDYTTQNYFCDLDSLFLTAVPFQGVGPFSFIWETGETTQTIMIPLALGDYMLTMTDANGCVSIINCHIKPFAQVLYYPYNQNACEGDTATLFLDWFRDSIPGATYLWSTGETTPSITLTDDLVWSVTVTDPSNGCEFVIPPGLFDFHPTPYPEIVGPNILCNGETITLSITGGPFGNVFWHLPNGETYWAETLEVTEPGMYILWGSSPEAGYCWNQDTIVIIEDIIDPPLLNGPPDLCSGQSGIISLTNYALFEEYEWSNGETTSSITVNAPGTYTVTVTEEGGCTASESIIIEENDGADLTTDATSATCGQSDGSIDLSASPVQTYEYEWSNGATTADIDNVPPGTYSVTVTDINGCTSVTEEIVPDTPIDITITDNITPNTTCINFNGAININALPVLTYTYQWSNGATTEDISNLAPGVYSVTVTTGVNCSATAEFIVDDESNATDIDPSIASPTCGLENGSISLQLNGGTGPFIYLWSNGQTTQELLDIGEGNYYVTVTGADGCTSSAFIPLPGEDIPLIISGDIIPNTSCDISNGGIDITVSPLGTYDYNWSTGATSEDIYFLGAGTYFVTVTLGNSCAETGSFTILNENIPFTVDGTSGPNTSCTAPNGYIDLFISPSGSYTYEWSTGSTNEDISNLEGGNYIVTVTNSDSCSISSSFTVGSIIPDIEITGLIIDNTSCQVPNGSIDISVSPPGFYSFLWSTGATTEDLQNETTGTYHITVTDANGCTADTLFTIGNQSATFTLSAVLQTNTSCTTPNGIIDLTINPVGTYTYLWSNGSVTEDLGFISGGNFSVSVTDNNSCSETATYLVNDSTTLPDISSNIMDEVCSQSNGSIDLNVTPTGNTYLWSTGDTIEDLINISAGTYLVTVTGSNGCSITDTFDVANGNSNFSLSAIPADNSSCTNPNGSLNLQITPAGVYTFLWSTGATTEDLQNISAGTYQVTVTDPSNCSSTASFTILSNTVDPIITENIIPATCGQINGGINITVTPGIGNTYLWSTGSMTEDLQNLAPGNYSVTVTSNNGCTASSNFMVPNNNTNFSIIGAPTANTSCIAPNGSINLNIIPVDNYTYLWSNGANTEDLINLPAGLYSVTVTDKFGCSSSLSYTIDNNSNAPVIIGVILPETCGQNNGSIEISVTPSGVFSFLWSDGVITKDRVGLAAGIYQLTVTDGMGCTSAAIYDVLNQNSNFSVSSQISNETSCIAPNGSINLTIIPSGSYTFMWSNGAVTEDLSNLPSGIYEVTVSDLFQCSFTEIFAIENTNTFPVLSSTITPATCGNSNGSIDLDVTPPAEYSFIWSTGDIIEDLENIIPGVYSVTVTDLDGCTSESVVSLPGSPPLEITLDADLTALQNGLVICSLQLNVPLTAIDSIFWLPFEILSCYEPLCTEQKFAIVEKMEVLVMVRDTFGCIAQASLLLDVDKEFRVYIPNVFTPNGDGPNEMFTIYANIEVEEIVELEIFDRWGNCVFINKTFPPNEPAYGWDGIYKGKLMNPDVFAYRAIVRYSNGEEHAFKGDVTLVR